MANNYQNKRNNGQNRQQQNNNQQPQQQNPMKAATNMFVDAEARTATFKKTCNFNGLNKTGTFVAKYPTITDRIAIGSMRAKMLGGAPSQSVDTYTDDLAFMVAYLKVLLVKTPNWFDLTKLEDDTLLRELFQEVSNWVADFRQSNVAGENGGFGATADDEEDMGSDEAVPGSN